MNALHKVMKCALKEIVVFSLLLAGSGLSEAASVSFSYDLGGRLTRAAYGDGQSISYVYDGAGNIINLAVTGLVTPSTVTIVASSGMNGVSGMGGSIQPTGATEINYGTNCAFTVTALPFTNISYLLIDGVVTTPASSYTFSSVTRAHSIHAEFINKTQDMDNDGLLDSWEIQYFGQLSATNGSGDADADGLSDRAEYAYGAHPKNKDTDGDNMPDKWEVDHGFDPAKADGDLDADGDGWSNYNEYRASTDPWNVLSHPVLGGTAPILNLLLK